MKEGIQLPMPVYVEAFSTVAKGYVDNGHAEVVETMLSSTESTALSPMIVSMLPHEDKEKAPTANERDASR